MRSRIVAIPLLAAVWVGSPALASTQDPDARVITMPVQEPEDAARIVAPRFKEILTGDTSPQPTPAVAEQRGNRGGGNRGGGDRGDGSRGGDRGANRGDDRGANRGGGDRERGTSRADGERGDRGQPNRADRRGDGDRRGDSRSNSRVVVVPRSSPSVVINYGGSRRGYIYPAYNYDPWIRRSYGWSPVRYAPWGWIYGTSGLASFGFGYGGNAPYSGYGYSPYYGYSGYYGASPYSYGGGYYSNRPSTFDTGGVRLRVRPRDAQVFVDGYYAGVVDDFDGAFQDLRLSPGGHKIEVRMPGFETAFFDVHIQPGRTIDVREDLRPRP